MSGEKVWAYFNESLMSKIREIGTEMDRTDSAVIRALVKLALERIPRDEIRKELTNPQYGYQRRRML